MGWLIALVMPCQIQQVGGLDRDTILTEAPATPAPSVLRLSWGTAADLQGDGSTGVDLATAGSLMWVPIAHLALDIGGYYQDAALGPSARVRYQILEQGTHGIALSAGARVKAVGFTARPGDATPPHEVEALLAVGREIGPWAVILNAVVGAEWAEAGRDAEAKMSIGYRLREDLQVGLDGRLQAEIAEEEAAKEPHGDEVAFAAGLMSTYVLTDSMQIRGLVGASKARGLKSRVGPSAQVAISLDL